MPMTSCGSLTGASSELKLHTALVTCVLRTTSVTMFLPAAFSAFRKAVTSTSYHFAPAPVTVNVATCGPTDGRLFHVSADSFHAVADEPNAANAIDGF